MGYRFHHQCPDPGGRRSTGELSRSSSCAKLTALQCEETAILLVTDDGYIVGLLHGRQSPFPIHAIMFIVLRHYQEVFDGILIQQISTMPKSFFPIFSNTNQHFHLPDGQRVTFTALLG